MALPTTETAGEKRWELYRLLGEPARLRLLGLAAEEELSIGELAELLAESQPNVSRHVAALRRAGLLAQRRQGTRAFVRIGDGVGGDAVVADALAAGRELCVADGSLGRAADLVRRRDADAREFFARHEPGAVDALPAELPAYLTALRALIPRRRLAVDAGTGAGNLLDVLAPLYERVVAVDRAGTQLEHARARLARRGYDHVELIEADYDAPEVRARLEVLGGADAVFASRVLHHAPRPASALRALSALAAPGGAVIVIDYGQHQDERLRAEQADHWLGFDRRELAELARRAGLRDPTVTPIPGARCGAGPDGHLPWQVLAARVPDREER